MDTSRENSVRRRIVAGARRHFFAHGFRSVTMDDLASELAMSKKTFYAHFAGKEELLKAVLQEKFREAGADFDRIAAECSGDVVRALQHSLATVQRHTEELQPPYLRDMMREAPESFRLVETRRREIIQRHFGKLFAEGRKAGIFRKDIPTGLAIEILLGAIQGILNPPKLAELGLTPKTGFSAIISVVLEGLVTE